MSVKPSLPRRAMRPRSIQSLLYMGGVSLVMLIALFCFVRTLFFLGGVLDTLLSPPAEGGIGVTLQTADFTLVSQKLRLVEEPVTEAPPATFIEAPLTPAPSTTEEIISDVPLHTATSTETE